MNPSGESPPPKPDQLPPRTIPAVAGGLMGLGLVFGAGALWPEILDEFGISDRLFGLISGIGLAISFPVLLMGDWLNGRLTKFALMALSLVILAVSMFSLGLGLGGALGFALILLLRGLGAALMDLSANALAMDIERITAKHLMGPLHAAFNGGAIVSAGLIAVLLAVAVGFQWILTLFAVILTVLAFYALPLRSIELTSVGSKQAQPGSMRAAARNADVRRAALLLGLSFAGEIVAIDWTALFIEDQRGTAGSYAAICVGVFGAAMLVGRLSNGIALARFGLQNTLLFQGALTVVGGAFLVSGNMTFAPIVGCAIGGVGLAGVGPTALSVAGIAMPDKASAAAGFTLAGGYIGLAGVPVLAGTLSDAFSTRATMSIMVVAGIGIVIVAALLPKGLDQPRGSSSTSPRAS